MDGVFKSNSQPTEEANENALPNEAATTTTTTEPEHPISANSDVDSFVENPVSDSSSLSDELPVFNVEQIDDDQEVSPFLRRGPLIPKAPVSVLVENDNSLIDQQQRVLPSQPSIIGRMMDPNKHYVDPKDARTLLPGVLFQSGSLDLDGVIEEGVMEQLKQTEEAKLKERIEKEAALLHYFQTQGLERINENVLYGAQQQQQQQQQDHLLSASNLDLLANMLNERCRVANVAAAAAAANSMMTTPQLDATNSSLLHHMMPRGRHVRSVSEPTFAFPDNFQTVSPFHQTLNPPGASLVDTNAETLALLGLTPTAATAAGGSFQQPNWTTLQQPTTPSLFQNDQASIMADFIQQQQHHHQQQQQQQESISQLARNRKKTGPSRSVDFVASKQTKRNGVSNKEKLQMTGAVPGTPSKNPTKAEVKKLVDKQTSMGRPTYAPWFRNMSGCPTKTNTKDDMQIGGNLASPMQQPITQVFSGHNRSVSTPGIAFNLGETEIPVMPPPPPPTTTSVSQNQNSKGKGAGTGVFLPRLPT
eukprot:g3932.t1